MDRENRNTQLIITRKRHLVFSYVSDELHPSLLAWYLQLTYVSIYPGTAMVMDGNSAISSDGRRSFASTAVRGVMYFLNRLTTSLKMHVCCIYT